MRFIADLQEVKYQQLPKKIVLRDKLPIASDDGEAYYINVSVWIPDTPYSRYKPKVVLTISHGKAGRSRQYIKIVGRNPKDICAFASLLFSFAYRHLDILNKKYSEALMEWEEFQRKAMEYQIQKIPKEETNNTSKK